LFIQAYLKWTLELKMQYPHWYYAKATCQTWRMQYSHINKIWIGKHVGIQILHNWLIQQWTFHDLILHNYPKSLMKNLGTQCGYYQLLIWVLYSWQKNLVKNLGTSCKYCGVTMLQNEWNYCMVAQNNQWKIWDVDACITRWKHYRMQYIWNTYM